MGPRVGFAGGRLGRGTAHFGSEGLRREELRLERRVRREEDQLGRRPGFVLRKEKGRVSSVFAAGLTSNFGSTGFESTFANPLATIAGAAPLPPTKMTHTIIRIRCGASPTESAQRGGVAPSWLGDPKRREQSSSHIPEEDKQDTEHSVPALTVIRPHSLSVH